MKKKRIIGKVETVGKRYTKGMKATTCILVRKEGENKETQRKYPCTPLVFCAVIKIK